VLELKELQNRLADRERYKADLDRKIIENNARLRKHEEELNALRKQSDDLDRSTADMLRQIKNNH